jgi:hypothetical protein
VVIVGAEVAAEIEHASPWGKEPAEKVPWQKEKDRPQLPDVHFRERPWWLDSGRGPPKPAVAAFSPQPSMLERLGVFLPAACELAERHEDQKLKRQYLGR